jgi:hypothetical protein
MKKKEDTAWSSSISVNRTRKAELAVDSNGCMYAESPLEIFTELQLCMRYLFNIAMCNSSPIQYITHTQLCKNYNSIKRLLFKKFIVLIIILLKDFFLKINWPIIKRVPKQI